MRQILIAIAIVALLGCGQTGNAVDKTHVPSNTSILVDNNACPFVEELIAKLESKRKAYAPDHPDVRRLISQINRGLEECRDLGLSLAGPDDAPPNSKVFSFNGYTYYVVPLNSVGSHAEASR